VNGFAFRSNWFDVQSSFFARNFFLFRNKSVNCFWGNLDRAAAFCVHCVQAINRISVRMGYMNSQICKCCGRPLGEPEKNLSAHPNLCVECTTAGELIEEPPARLKHRDLFCRRGLGRVMWSPWRLPCELPSARYGKIRRAPISERMRCSSRIVEVGSRLLICTRSEDWINLFSPR